MDLQKELATAQTLNSLQIPRSEQTRHSTRHPKPTSRTRPPPEGTGPRPLSASATDFKISMAFTTFGFGETTPWPIDPTPLPAPAPPSNASLSLPFLKMAVSSLASTVPGRQRHMPCGFEHRKESLAAQFTLEKSESVRASIHASPSINGSTEALP